MSDTVQSLSDIKDIAADIETTDAPAVKVSNAPLREQVFIASSCVAAVVLPVVLSDQLAANRFRTGMPPDWFALLVLVAVSALNVEIGRALYGGLAHAQQPHKALSAGAVVSAMILPTSTKEFVGIDELRVALMRIARL
ncbi:MAG: hypothetical protein IBJ05_07580 [Blastomonas sp.]|nr:hypothetical protein [Blastomonas sp.]